MEAFWYKAKEAIKRSVRGQSFKMWIEPLELSGFRKGSVVLTCPNIFYKNYVLKTYGSIIESEIQKALGSDCKVTVEVASKSEKSKKTKPVQDNTPLDNKTLDDIVNWDGQMTIPGDEVSLNKGRMLRNDFTFDNFVVGENNDFAYSAALSMASKRNNDQSVLFILSKNGMGKTHLSQAMGHYILSQYPADRLYYMTAEDFANEMVMAYKNSTIDKFKWKYRENCDVLLLEDIHYLTGKDNTQTELSFALDYMLEEKKKVIFTSCYLPTDIPKMSEHLRSRISCGLISTIDAPNYNTRVKILQKKSAERGYFMPEEIINYLSSELTDNVRQLESGLISVAAKSSLLGVPVDLDLAQSVIKNIVRQSKAVTIDIIKKLVCKQYGVTPNDLVSASRKQSVVIPRQVAIYLSRQYTHHPLQIIGKQFNRYHATVMHSISLIEQKIKENSSIRKQVEYICQKLDAGKF